MLAITCAGLMVWAWNVPTIYNKWYNNVLESSFILNLAILAAASYQARVEGGNQTAIVNTSASITFVTFLGIVVYHIISWIQESRFWKRAIGPKLELIWQILTHRDQQHRDPMDMALTAQPVAPPQPVTTTFVDLREPLLESQH